MSRQIPPPLTTPLSRSDLETAERPRVGILGGGQLARMTAQAAVPLGVEIFVLEREAESPAGQIVGAGHEVVGDWRDRTALAQLAENVDLITLENEFIALNVIAAGLENGASSPRQTSKNAIRPNVLRALGSSS